MVAFNDSQLGPLVDLYDPGELVVRGLRPSRVATDERAVTREIARRLHEEGGPGFSWWSTLEASWVNVTLFAERALPLLRLVEPPTVLTVDHPAVRSAGERLGVGLR